MKILHTADWHLGKVVMGRSMLEEQRHFIDDSLLPAIDRTKPDAVIIAGDIFDRQIPPVEAVCLFSSAVAQICKARHVKLAVIAGNHDGADRLAVYSDLLREGGLYISAHPFDTKPLCVEDGFGLTQIHFLPYFDAAQARDALGRDDVRGMNAAFSAVVSEMVGKLEPKARHVLIGHCFAAGGAVGEAESPLTVGGSDSVDLSVCAPFDYVALGHLHGPQKAGKNGRYSGSPIKYSFDEEHQKKSMALIEILPDKIETSYIPCEPIHDMRTITGTVASLVDAAANDPARDDYIYAELTDTRPFFEPMAALREYYPNILGLHPGWLYTNMEKEHCAVSKVSSGGDRLLYEEFLNQVCGVEPETDEIVVFEEMMKKVAQDE